MFSSLTAADDELAFLDRYVELIEREVGDRERDAKTLGVALIARKSLDIVGRVAVGGFADAVEHALDFVEAEKKTDWTTMAHETLQSPLKRLWWGPQAAPPANRRTRRLTRPNMGRDG